MKSTNVHRDEQSDMSDAMQHIVEATMGQTARSCAMSQLKYLLDVHWLLSFTLSNHEALTECIFHAMVLKTWLIGMKN